MNLRSLSGGWHELRGKLHSAWSRLTDEDLRRIENNWDELSTKLQKTYGFTQEEALEEVENFREEYLDSEEKKDSPI